MKKDEILENMNEIEDEVITEAAKAGEDQRSPKGMKAVAITVCALAAVLVLGVFGVVMKKNGGFRQKYPSYPTTAFAVSGLAGDVPETQQDIIDESTWDSMKLCYKFHELSYNGVNYEVMEGAGIEDFVGEHLADVTITGRDNINEKDYERNASLFQMKNVREEAALIVQYEGSDELFTAINPWFRATTLKDFAEALDLYGKVVVRGDAYIYEQDQEGKWHDLYLETVTKEMLSEKVFSPYLDLPLEESEEAFWSRILIRFSVSLPAYGQESANIGITENGYLTTNIFQTGKSFYIGVDAAREIASYMKENLDIYEIVQPEQVIAPATAGEEDVIIENSGAAFSDDIIEMTTEGDTVEETKPAE